jgi:hypothetical protein
MSLYWRSSASVQLGLGSRRHGGLDERHVDGTEMTRRAEIAGKQMGSEKSHMKAVSLEMGRLISGLLETL